jgi:HK97 family phage prohead protease
MDPKLSGTFTRIVQLKDVKARTSDPGGFEGYGSIFNNIDSYGDVVVKGAFKKTIPSFLSSGFASVGHAWSDIPVATFSEAHEDDTGLWVVADFHTDDYSQRSRKVFSERIERGKTVGLSIGFSINEGGAIWAGEDTDFGTGIRILKDLELFEVALVNVPANPQALAAAIKSRAMCDDPTCGCRLGGTHHQGLKFAEHSGALHAEIEGFLARARALMSVRSAQQRAPSEVQLEGLSAIRDSLGESLKAVEGLLSQETPEPDTKTTQEALHEIARYEIQRALALGVKPE